jgi:hypothetical protein
VGHAGEVCRERGGRAVAVGRIGGAVGGGQGGPRQGEDR